MSLPLTPTAQVPVDTYEYLEGILWACLTSLHSLQGVFHLEDMSVGAVEL